MAFGELLEQIREYYVERFLAAVNEQAADEEATTVHETAFCGADGQIFTEGQLGLPYRGDLIKIRAGEVVDSMQIDTEEMLGFEPVEFDWPDSEMKVVVQPFQWNWLQVQLRGLPDDVQWQPLCEWFMRWFHEHDPPEDELLQGVHFLSDPTPGDGYQQVALDLGTAPVEAFEEMLEALNQMHAAEICIGQFSDD